MHYRENRCVLKLRAYRKVASLHSEALFGCRVFHAGRARNAHTSASPVQDKLGIAPTTTATMTTRPDPVTPFALNTPLFNVLAGKRVVLASSSPRRKQILASVVRPTLLIQASAKARALTVVCLTSLDRRAWSQRLCRAHSKKTCQSRSSPETPFTSTPSRQDPRRSVHGQRYRSVRSHTDIDDLFFNCSFHRLSKCTNV